MEVGSRGEGEEHVEAVTKAAAVLEDCSGKCSCRGNDTRDEGKDTPTPSSPCPPSLPSTPPPISSSTPSATFAPSTPVYTTLLTTPLLTLPWNTAGDNSPNGEATTDTSTPLLTSPPCRNPTGANAGNPLGRYPLSLSVESVTF